MRRRVGEALLGDSAANEAAGQIEAAQRRLRIDPDESLPAAGHGPRSGVAVQRRSSQGEGELRCVRRADGGGEEDASGGARAPENHSPPGLLRRVPHQGLRQARSCGRGRDHLPGARSLRERASPRAATAALFDALRLLSSRPEEPGRESMGSAGGGGGFDRGGLPVDDGHVWGDGAARFRREGV